MDTNVVLFSGGIDSFIMYHWLQSHPSDNIPVYFDLKSKYSEKEKAVVQKLIPNIIIDESLNLGSREEGEKAIIPLRNLLLAIQAIKYGNVVWIAGLADDRAEDKTPKAFNIMSEIINGLAPNSVIRYKVLSPFWDMTKADVVKWFLTSDMVSIPKEERAKLLLQTTSCYHPTEHYCGRCPSCFRKWVAFHVNDIDLYFNNFKLMQAYGYEALDPKSSMHPQRKQDTLKTILDYFLGEE